jgi:hypothetical protein
VTGSATARVPPPNPTEAFSGRPIREVSTTAATSTGRTSFLIRSTTSTASPSCSTSKPGLLALTDELSSSICRFTRPTTPLASFVTQTVEDARLTSVTG